MKKFKYIVVLLFLASSLIACDKRYEDLLVSPNDPTTAAPINILHSLVMDTWFWPWDDESNDCQFFVETLALYDDQDYLFGEYGMNYNEILNIKQMYAEVESNGSDDLKAFYPVGKFLEAYFYIMMTDRLGDIPMSEAVMGDEGNFTPAYDTQKEVYTACLELLEEANEEIQPFVEAGINIGEDLYFSGDLVKWQKAINTFHVRLLLNLSKRTDEMDVAARLSTIVLNPAKYPLMESGADNMQITYAGGTNDCYVLYPDETFLEKSRNGIGLAYMNLIQKYEDPRIFIQATPADSVNVDVVGRERMFDSYIGLNAGLDMTVLNNQLTSGLASYVNFDTYINATGLPTVQLGYPELQFSLAEAAHRGWISGDAATYYTNGIVDDMEFYGVSQDDIDTFLARSENQYPGATDQGLTMILEQKYVAFFQNSGYQAFYEQRRTGVPTFDVGVGNKNGSIPKRWTYPDDERINNSANLTEALVRQFGGTDDINNVMWLVE
ncbi:MAG: SusD/RagB family nutrient-binding outer membrane lipoprotein [Rikenellaceae bacterium]